MAEHLTQNSEALFANIRALGCSGCQFSNGANLLANRSTHC